MVPGRTSAPNTTIGGSGKYWIGDGWHRYLAAKKAGREKIAALVHPGGKDEAIEHACGSNQSHGLRRTREDVRRSIKLMLVNLAHKNYGDREIARRVICSHTTVALVRSELGAIGQLGQSADGKRTEIRNGKEVVRDISANQRPRAPQPESTLGHAHGAMANLSAAPPRKADIPEPIVVSRAESSDPDSFPIEVLEQAEEERRNEAAPPRREDAAWEEANADGSDFMVQSGQGKPTHFPWHIPSGPDPWAQGLRGWGAFPVWRPTPR